MFALRLNRMVEATESCTFVAYADTEEKLISWYESLLAPEPYIDEIDYDGFTKRWHKTFLKGSPLEWFNPYNANKQLFTGHPAIIKLQSKEEMIEESAANISIAYDNLLASMIAV